MEPIRFTTELTSEAARQVWEQCSSPESVAPQKRSAVLEPTSKDARRRGRNEVPQISLRPAIPRTRKCLHFHFCDANEVGRRTHTSLPSKLIAAVHQRGAVFGERRSCKRQRKQEKKSNKTSGDVLSPEICTSGQSHCSTPKTFPALLFKQRGGTENDKHCGKPNKFLQSQGRPAGREETSPPSLRPAYQSRRGFLRPRKM